METLGNKISEIKKTRNIVVLLGILFAFAIIPVLIVMHELSFLTFVFLCISLFGMIVHWLLLVSFTDALVHANKTHALFQGVFLFFPVALSLSMLFVAGHINRRLLIPAGAGVLALPFAVTFYSFFRGLLILFRSPTSKEYVHD
jgi:hypothetical protein